MRLVRRVRDEMLDALAPDDPRAQRSRRDLRRVHRTMGTCGLLAGSLEMSGPPSLRLDADRLEVLELGAGDGTLMLRVARRIAARWPPVRLTLLDRVDIVSPETRAGFQALDWQTRVVSADVLDWAAGRVDAPVTDSSPDADLIITTLFLHHFEGAALDALLAGVVARGQRFVALEPRRDRLALAGSHLVALLGANAVTRQDAVLSVHAGFRDAELSAAWPDPHGAWHLHEARAGAFAHRFEAQRLPAAA